jgi:nicotinic acid mononucleotide adenylyltransferase
MSSTKTAEPLILPIVVKPAAKFLDIVTIKQATSSPESTLNKQTYSSPLITAGVPILELIRKLEDEKVLSRSDRAIVNEILNDMSIRDVASQLFRDVELGIDRQLSIRNLREFVRKYKSGVSTIESPRKPNVIISSAQPHISVSLENSPESCGIRRNVDSFTVTSASVVSAVSDIHSTINKVLSDKPMYSIAGSNVCLKIARRLAEVLRKYDPVQLANKRFCIIAGSGSFNPLTRMHLRTYFLAKNFIESKTDMIVLGCLLSPAHRSVVLQRYRQSHAEILPCPHRLAIAQFCVQDTKFLSIDPWEITRRRSMDYISFLNHVDLMMKFHFPDIDIRVIYQCKGSCVPKLSISSMKAGNYGCVVVCRQPESENLRTSLGSRWNGILYIAEDSAILDATMDSVSAKKVREKLMLGLPVDTLVGDTVSEYLRVHKIGLKVKEDIIFCNLLKSYPYLIN